jgi:hypothetical protein
MARHLDEAAFAEEAEVFGNLHLRLAEQFLEMTHAKRTAAQRVQDAESDLIAKALVDLDKRWAGHAVYMPKKVYSVNGI